MLTENTISKLREIRLGTMAEAFREQLTNPEISSLSFEDRFGLLVDAEWTTRKNNTLARMIKKAQFADPSACIENISYLPQRNLDKAQIVNHASKSPLARSFKASVTQEKGQRHGAKGHIKTLTQ